MAVLPYFGRALFVGAAGVLLPVANPVLAKPTAATGLEEVVVTARRREEMLQSVPVAITALTGADIESKQVEAVTDLQRYVPSLAVASAGALSLRGQTEGSFGAGTLPGVQVYFNEVSTTAVGPGSYYDLQNLQVLKGPQGTLFGRNSTGGAILFTSQAPGNAFGGYLQGSVGSHDLRQFTGAVDLPVVDDVLLVRLAADVQRREGYTNVVSSGERQDDRDYQAARLTVSWRPSDNLQNDLVVNGFRSDARGGSHLLTHVNPVGLVATQQLFPGTTLFGRNGLGGDIYRELAAQQAMGPRHRVGAYGYFGEAGVGSLDRNERWTVIDTATWTITDQLALKNIVSYGEERKLRRADMDGTGLPIIDTLPTHTSTFDQITEELQLQGTAFDDRLDWVAGLYYQRNRSDRYAGGFTLALPPALAAFDRRNPSSSFSDVDDTTRAVFGQGTYDLSGWVEGLSMTAGARYTEDERQVITRASNPAGCTQGAAPDCELRGDGTFRAPSWTVGLDYQVTSETLLYLSLRRGYKSGGFNLSAPAGSPQEYDPEYLTDLEVGVKSDWSLFSVPLRTNLDVFYGKYTDIQIGLPVFNPSTRAVSSVVDNAGKAVIKGVEFESTVLPLPGVELGLMYSYNDASYDEYESVSIDPVTGVATAVDRSDTPFLVLPKNKAGVSLRYTLPLPAGIGSVSAVVNYTWQGKMYLFADASDPNAVAPRFELFNASIDWADFLGYPIDLSVFVTNARNELYVVEALTVYNSLGISGVTYGEPRMWGLKLKYRFGSEG